MTLQYVLVALGSAVFVFLIYKALTRRRHVPKEKAAKNAGFFDVEAAEICDMRRNKIIINMQKDIDALRHEIMLLKRDVNNNKSNVRNVSDIIRNIDR